MQESTLFDYFCEGDLGDEKNGGILTLFTSAEKITLTSLVALANRSQFFCDIDETDLTEIAAGVEALRTCYREMVVYHREQFAQCPDDYPLDTHKLFHIGFYALEAGWTDRDGTQRGDWFITDDGYLLRAQPHTGTWTDGDLSYPMGSPYEMGHPMDSNGNRLGGQYCGE